MDFDERQYLGYNKSSLSLRLAMSLFCFILAWFSDSPFINGDLLFLLGIIILAVSIILLFVTHLRTQITPDKMILTRLLGTAKIELDLKNVVKAEKVVYSKYLIDYPVYNLHSDHQIRFYTGGSDAVQLQMNDGLTYIIGSSKPLEFIDALRERVPSVQ